MQVVANAACAVGLGDLLDEFREGRGGRVHSGSVLIRRGQVALILGMSLVRGRLTTTAIVAGHDLLGPQGDPRDASALAEGEAVLAQRADHEVALGSVVRATGADGKAHFKSSVARRCSPHSI